MYCVSVSIEWSANVSINTSVSVYITYRVSVSIELSAYVSIKSSVCVYIMYCVSISIEWNVSITCLCLYQFECLCL